MTMRPTVIRWTTLNLVLLLGLSIAVQSQQGSSSEKNTEPAGNVFDRPKNRHDDADFIVVPAGQEINIEVVSPGNSVPTSAITEGKVVVPVRIGFTTAIEALTKVHLRYAGNGPFYRLVSLRIGKKVYKTETDLAPAGLEMRFTLTRPLRIRRN